MPLSISFEILFVDIEEPPVGGFSFSTPEHVHRVFSEDTVGGQDRHLFRDRLGDDQTIEGILMVGREIIDADRMKMSHRKRPQSLFGHERGYALRGRTGKMQLSQPCFDT